MRNILKDENLTKPRWQVLLLNLECVVAVGEEGWGEIEILRKKRPVEEAP